MKEATQAKPRLTRQDWIDSAIDLLVEGGIGAVSVEQLATRLCVTRGSFYHHFSDRDDLLQAMLDYWAEHWTYAIRERVASLGLDPATTLLALVRTIRKQGAADYDAPFRAWALHDSRARTVIQQVDNARLKFIKSLFDALGFAGLDAENRARLLLNYEVAAPATFAKLSTKQDERLLEERLRFLTNARVH